MKKNVSIGAMCLMLLSFAVVSCNTANKKSGNEGQKTGEIVAVAAGDIKIATVNTDSLFTQFDMVVDMTGEIERTEKKLQTDLQNQARTFQQEYENYLKVGASLTLSEQKKKEEYLTQKKDNLDRLSTQYADQMMQLRMQKTQDIQDKIFSFIKEYNDSHDKYTFIISNARTSGVLYSPENIDITKEILDAMNEDYAKTKKSTK